MGRSYILGELLVCRSEQEVDSYSELKITLFCLQLIVRRNLLNYTSWHSIYVPGVSLYVREGDVVICIIYTCNCTFFVHCRNVVLQFSTHTVHDSW